MSDFDFNNADPQREMGALIPENTVVLVVASLRPGGNGPGGWLKASSTGAQMLDFEFTIDGGEFDRRKVWENWVTDGVTEGHAKAANITRSRCRALLESVHGISPKDDSAEAVAARRVDSWGDFDGLRFCAKIGIEPGGLKDKTAGPDSERYADKNKLKAILTPDDDDYIAPVATAKPKAAKTGAAKAGAAKPSWAA